MDKFWKYKEQLQNLSQKINRSLQPSVVELHCLVEWVRSCHLLTGHNAFSLQLPIYFRAFMCCNIFCRVVKTILMPEHSLSQVISTSHLVPNEPYTLAQARNVEKLNHRKLRWLVILKCLTTININGVPAVWTFPGMLLPLWCKKQSFQVKESWSFLLTHLSCTSKQEA